LPEHHGQGVRDTLGLIREIIPIAIREVASGTRVLDWTVPNEWNLREAWIKDLRGKTIIDFRQSNLHVVSYSAPVSGRIGIDELRSHLFTLPEHPDWIPYRTSYYRETWGFCLSHNQLREMTNPEYEVRIDSTLEPGHLVYGELLVPGASSQELLISAHICHPSLCNDNLSGIGIAAHLARHLLSVQHRRYSYRFLFIPGTIGAITWLAQNRNNLSRIRGGLTLVCLGDSSPLSYKRTLAGNTEVDHAVSHAFQHMEEKTETIDYVPYGYDERQFNSPGFRLPIGSLMRGRHGQFPGYHTSADNLAFVHREQLASSYEALRKIIEVLEANRTFLNLFPYGEPQLGRRGVYREMSSANHDHQLALLWILSLSDGSHSLLDIAERSGFAMETLRDVAEILLQCGVIEEK